MTSIDTSTGSPSPAHQRPRKRKNRFRFFSQKQNSAPRAATLTIRETRPEGRRSAALLLTAGGALAFLIAALFILLWLIPLFEPSRAPRVLVAESLLYLTSGICGVTAFTMALCAFYSAFISPMIRIPVNPDAMRERVFEKF